MTSIVANHYVLAVPDRRRSAEFYVDVLGFEIAGDPDGWIFVKRDNCMIMLGECPDATPARELGDHSYFGYLVVEDADAFHERVQSRGVEVIAAIGDRPWGMREFGLRTPDGHRIMIGHRLTSSTASESGG